ncbi:MAG TPA: tRNA (N(6)-L-threonylcarbamoyladenosine(37)-C(2))-methylthiotransferase MtaB [Ignavibacteriaceae bacterium]|nr:tRNA (N(6)-L-threonylcarbamoyladenosine(37)-C(2))-methylthiotransferase MtaB [Ignavibacteriaceae bacterium]
MNQKVALHTLGCKLNFSETSTIGKQFKEHGFSIVSLDDNPDVFVINTCTVTENAERECRQIVRRVLRKNPHAYIVVTGCYAQLRPESISKIDGVDLVLGSNEKFNMFSYIESLQKNELACIFVSPTDELNQFGIASSSDADSRTRAYFKIQDGCDYKCSFCTIPQARGLSRSLESQQVVSQFKDILAQEYKEIILTGVNVGDYGKSLDKNLFSLLKELIVVEGDYRLRISSIEPNLLSDEIINLTKEHPRLTKHFHIPLQSGSEKILKLMQRRYTKEFYADLIYKVKQVIPDAGIGVDVIVGFPGESENDFVETYNFLKELPISYLHVFTYSERPNTKAVTMADSVPVNIRRDRNNMLRILSEKKKFEFYKSLIGNQVEVLFENENDAGFMKGFTSNYVRVKSDFKGEYINKFTTFEICDCDNSFAYGKIIGQK